MNIQLKDWKVNNLNLSLLDEVSIREKKSFDLQTACYFPSKEDDDKFGIGFKLKLSDKVFDLFVEAIFHFELIDEKISQEFKQSSFPKVNAPAIAFPYLRAFVSNLTLQAGLEPVILPSINFVSLAREASEEN